jgi:hypothetical protein
MKKCLAGSAANWGSAERDAARAASFAASAQRIAAGLEHVAAGSVAATASDATTVFGHLALGVSAAKIALKHNLAIP